jgi:hypothetical protein
MPTFMGKPRGLVEPFVALGRSRRRLASRERDYAQAQRNRLCYKLRNQAATRAVQR